MKDCQNCGFRYFSIFDPICENCNIESFSNWKDIAETIVDMVYSPLNIEEPKSIDEILSESGEE